jgi:hypothetical protein
MIAEKVMPSMFNAEFRIVCYRMPLIDYSSLAVPTKFMVPGVPSKERLGFTVICKQTMRILIECETKKTVSRIESVVTRGLICILIAELNS